MFTTVEPLWKCYIGSDCVTKYLKLFSNGNIFAKFENYCNLNHLRIIENNCKWSLSYVLWKTSWIILYNYVAKKQIHLFIFVHSSTKPQQLPGSWYFTKGYIKSSSSDSGLLIFYFYSYSFDARVVNEEAFNFKKSFPTIAELSLIRVQIFHKMARGVGWKGWIVIGNLIIIYKSFQ